MEEMFQRTALDRPKRFPVKSVKMVVLILRIIRPLGG